MEETPQDHLSDDARAKLLAARDAVQDATLGDLFGKPNRKTAFFVTLADEEGRPVPRRIRYQAISPKAFDRMLAAHAPNVKDERKGAQWNPDTFPPSLISAVSLMPKMSVEEATELLEMETWSTGEVNALFRNALDICQAGFDVPFNAGD